MIARLLVLAAVLLAGCTTSDPSTVEDQITGAPAPVPARETRTTVTTASGGPGRTIVVGGTDAVPEPRDRPGAARPPSTTSPGSWAGHYLRSSASRRILVQVLTQPGAEPEQRTVDRVVDLLADRSEKPVTVSGGAIDEVRSTWSGADLQAAADDVPVSAPSGTAVLRLLFVHGRSDRQDGEKVLGVAARGDVAAIFSDAVDEAGTALVSPSRIERAATVHEIGHLLGLVDLFLETGRADPDHPGHSRNARSVMYWAVESTLVGDLLMGGPPDDFDDADRADLATIRHG